MSLQKMYGKSHYVETISNFYVNLPNLRNVLENEDPRLLILFAGLWYINGNMQSTCLKRGESFETLEEQVPTVSQRRIVKMRLGCCIIAIISLKSQKLHHKMSLFSKKLQHK